MVCEDPTAFPTTLVIDTSYGSTVSVVGEEPIHEADSRLHVERLQPNIAAAIERAGLEPKDISRIVVGTGPAPFTGLRAGIVAAKALAFALDAQLLGQDVLEPQAVWQAERRLRADGGVASDYRHLVLAVNDARRRQLYYRLYESVIEPTDASGLAKAGLPRPIGDMDIAYPNDIVERTNAIVSDMLGEDCRPIVVDVIGHGVEKYASAWLNLIRRGELIDDSVLHGAGVEGPILFARTAERHHVDGDECPSEPLYLRRPDVSVPNPLKHVLNHGGADRAGSDRAGSDRAGADHGADRVAAEGEGGR
ncbi:tRNA (adenosine(37)-N6)-threonylcarbamoyltransferase complex dimerization subunit type 1 TsaB [Bifidobacterium simiarum]|uniref:tRNA (Adenosine(37)-N6)-threonylcarbamoyltransferase complex dimerization subunit type 1 TsaB n=1 Tax=Bifidobacterium simiarum TaxID=2045441 RepID=A0A2M9HHB2_9BIFI|nr:tRNA (adenosine(37)-N6)-threonylcarbamoyltransferase complex dimerization subunit type 1 TsaB [Bifidobacterium simiarum]PJM76205.1 tRNA (adenosine(37)-N6)-threonylcarbamoyltransferase complex dimerization subunit type 1 TsaB [Bifidobacterium simiarum]